MRRTAVLAALAASLAAAPIVGTAAAQNRLQDPVSFEEVLEDQLSAPYYGETSEGYGRAQRPIVDKIPHKGLRGAGYWRTDVNYFKGVGKILTDLQDMTLYATSKDRDFEVSSVTGDALDQWRPLVVPEDFESTGLWGKAWNADMKTWVLTFADKPLYRFAGDEKPGDANGRGGDWYVMEVIG